MAKKKRTTEENYKEKLSALHDLTKEMSLSLDVDHITKLVLEAAEKILNFGNIALLLVDEEKNELYPKKIKGHEAPKTDKKIPLSGEKGISAHVARTGESINVPDVRKDDRYIFGLKNSRSELCVPLKVKDNIIGVLDTESTELDAFSQEDQQLLEILASQAAVAIENARLYNNIEKHLEELSLIHEVSNSILSILDLDELLSIIVSKIKKTFQYNLLSLLLIDEEKDELYIAAASGVSEEVKENLRLKVGEEGIVGRVAKEGTVELVNDVSSCPYYVEGIEKTRSEIAVPLKIKGKIIGVLDAQKKVKNGFSERDIRLLSNIASQVSVAIENARLYDQAQTKIAEQKESEKLYRSLSEYNEELLEHTPVGIMNINETMKVEYTNPEMERILSLPFGKEYDVLWMDLEEIPLIEELGISFCEDLEQEEAIEEEASFSTPTGERGYLKIRGVPLMEDGTFTGAVLIFNDITERKKAEIDLKESKEKIEQLHRIAAKMESLNSEEEIYDLIIEAAQRILEFDICSVTIAEDGYMVIKATSYNEIPGEDRVPIEGSLAGKTYRTGESQSVDDIQKERDVKPTENRFRSGLTVPLWNIGTFVGLSDTPNAFTQKDLELAELLISHATEALKRTRSEKDLRKSKKKIEQLHEISTQMESAQSEQNVYNLIIETAEKILEFDMCLVCTLEDGQLVVKASSSQMSTGEEQHLSPNKGIAGKTYRTGKPYLVKDLQKEKDARSVRAGERSLFSLPLGEKGVFQAISEKIDFFDEEDLELAELLLSHATEALKRIESEKGLKESEKRYRNLVERANDGIGIIQHGVFKYVNKRLVEIGGYTVEEVIDRPFTEFIHPDKVSEVKDRYKRRMAGEDVPSIYRTILRHKDGSKLYAEISAGKIFYRGESADLIIVRDITERRTIKKRLERSKEKIKQLHKAAIAMESAKTKKEIYHVIVNVAEKILDFDMCITYEEKDGMLLVKSASSGIPSEGGKDMTVDEGIAGKAYTTGKSIITKNMCEEKDAQPATEKYQSGITVPLGGKGVFQAISEKIDFFDEEDLELAELLLSHATEALKRIESEKGLKESEKRYRNLVEQSPNAIFVLDRKGNHVEANQKL